MKERPESNTEGSPIGWPEGLRLPSLEEAEKAVEQGEKMIEKMLKELQGKWEGTSPEMFNTQITI